MSIWKPKSAAAKDDEDSGGDDAVNRLPQSLIKTLLYDPHLMERSPCSGEQGTLREEPDSQIGGRGLPKQGE